FHITLLVYLSFTDTAPTDIYTLSLHDALPISVDDQHVSENIEIARRIDQPGVGKQDRAAVGQHRSAPPSFRGARFTRTRNPEERSEEHTSELQSRSDLVCRLLLEKKKTAECDA